MAANLWPSDFAMFDLLKIDRDLLIEAGVRRVTNREAREECGLVFGPSADLCGLAFPRIDPWTGRLVGYRVRRDHPEVCDGKPKAKYVSSFDRAHPYFVAGTTGVMLNDPTIPICLVEAEKSALAITAAARRSGRSLIVIALGGCWGWFGRIGKAEAADGTRVDEKGPLDDWNRMVWPGRVVSIAFDSNAAGNPYVQAAVRKTREDLIKREADVHIVTVPVLPGVNGPDDLIAEQGDDAWWAIVDGAETVAESHGNDSDLSQTDQIVKLGQAAGIELWHTPSGEAYATVTVADHREHHRLTRAVRRHFGLAYYRQTGHAARSAALADALQTLTAMALYDGAEYPATVRLASLDDTIYLDLGDADWKTIAIDASGWRVLSNAPVRNCRPSSLCALPLPTRGGSLDLLRELWPLDDQSWTLIVCWLVATFHPTGPFPVLVLMGEHGSGKSTLARMLRGLIDPAKPDLRGVPKDERDLMIGALQSSHVVAYDNMSYLQPWMSDALCRVATGAGFATRTLYSDTDETLIEGSRPILMTSIVQVATRGDLLDRALVVVLPMMPDDIREDEEGLLRRYEEIRPMLLGALCDAASMALARRSNVVLTRRPRMADAARFVTAAEPALGWDAGRAVRAWLGARAEASADLLSTDPVAEALLDMSLTSDIWKGTATELLARLCENLPVHVAKSKAWNNPKALSSALRKLTPDLRRAGLDITFPNGARAGRDRLMTIRRTPKRPDEQDGQDAPVELRAKNNDVPRPVEGTDSPTGHGQGAHSANNSGVVSGPSGPSGPMQALHDAENDVLAPGILKMASSDLVQLREGFVTSVAALRLLWSLENRGFELRLEEREGEGKRTCHIKVQPPHNLTTADAAVIRAHKEALIALMRYTPDDSHLFRDEPSAQRGDRRIA